ncbi:hypothetical protein J2T56_003071 [Natronobacillus azotifigens]
MISGPIGIVLGAAAGLGTAALIRWMSTIQDFLDYGII